ncbi:MAG: hypothetical protein P1V97_21745, partial [Planctomycetota bacterium]|nr:hypothetical protein [Planctomycetota bacterium]
GDEHLDKFIRCLVPYLGNKEDIFDALLEILNDKDRGDRQSFAMGCLIRTISLTGTNREIDENLLGLLENENLNVSLLEDLFGYVDLDPYQKDSKMADKLLRIARGAREEVRAVILSKLWVFQLDQVSTLTERVAFDSSESPQIRRAALLSLKNPGSHRDEILALTKHSHSELRLEAYRKIARMQGVPGFLEQIEASVKSEKDVEVLWAMAAYISRNQGPRGIPILQEIESRQKLDPYLRDYARTKRLEIIKKSKTVKSGEK